MEQENGEEKKHRCSVAQQISPQRSLRMLANRHAENRLRTEDFQIVQDEIDRMNRLLSDLLSFQQSAESASPSAAIFHGRR